MRVNTQQVELAGLKINSTDEDKGGLDAPTHTDSAVIQKRTSHMFFLHGLLGKGHNWRSFALNDALSNKRNMYLMDLRNHGDSDHHASMTYDEMAADLLRYAD